jgi:hypothetical protein
MENSARSEEILELGRKLVEELGLTDSNDTLGRWMAHYIADLILKADSATEGDKVAFQTEAFDAILELWKHRSQFPTGKRPFEEMEPIIRAVESLDPEDETPRYFRTQRPPRGEAAETSEQEKWLSLAEGLDYSAKLLIGDCLAEAAGAALDKSKEWVRLVEGIEDGVPEVVIRFISRADDLNKASDPNAAQRKLLSDRIKRLQGFTQIAASVAETLAKRLEALPVADTSDVSEGSASPTLLLDPFEDD